MGVTLTQPFPTGWGNPQKKGTTKLHRAFAQPPHGFGVGQSESIDFSNIQQQQAPLAAQNPLQQIISGLQTPANSAQTLKGALGNVGTQFAAGGGPWNTLGRSVGAIGDVVANVAPAVGGFLTAGVETPEEVAGRNMETIGRQEGAPLSESIGTAASFVDPGTAVEASGVKALPEVAKTVGAELANPRSPAGMVLRGPLSLAMGATGDVGRSAMNMRKAGEWTQALSEEASRVAPQVAEGVAQAIPKAPRPSRARLTMQQRQGMLDALTNPKYPSEMVAQVKDMLNTGKINQGNYQKALDTLAGNGVKMMKDALPHMNGEQAAKALDNVQSVDPNAFEQQGVDGLVTKAAAANKAGDGQVAQQSIAKAADMVTQERQQEQTAVAAANGRPPKPPKKPPKTTWPTESFIPPENIPPEAQTLVDTLPHLPANDQKSVVAATAKYLSKGQIAGHVLGGVSGAVGGYNLPSYTGKTPEERDDMKAKIIDAIAGGMVGLAAGDVITGGPARQIPERIGQQIMKGWLSPGNVLLKGVSDAPTVLVAPAMHGFERTFGFDGAFNPKLGWDQAVKYARGYRMGVKPALQAMSDVARNKSYVTAGLETGPTSLRATPGDVAGSVIPRAIGLVQAGTEELHKAAAIAADAPLLAKEQARLERTVKMDSAMDWFKDEIAKPAANPEETSMADAVSEANPRAGENIAVGNFDDPSVQAVAKEYYVQHLLDDYQENKLGNVTERARQWTLTSDIAPLLTGNLSNPKGIRFNPKGKTGVVGRVVYLPGSIISELNPTIAGVKIPVGRLLGGFYKIAANAIDQSINLTPFLGELNQLPYSEIKPAVRYGKQMLGGLATLALFHAIGDNAHGAGPTYDKKAFYDWLDKGNRQNSVQVFGHWIPAKDLGPFGWAAANAAGAMNDYRDYETYYKGKYGQDPNPEAIAGFSMQEFLQGITGESYFTSLNDLANMVLGITQGTSTGKSELAYELGGLSPETLAVPAMAQRQTTPNVASGGLTGDLRSRIPGFAGQLPPKQDAIGNPIPNPQEGWKALLGTYAGTQPMTDKTADIWLSPVGKQDGPGLAILNSREAQQVYDPTTKSYPAGSGLPMDADMQAAVHHLAGQILEAHTSELMNDPRFKAMTDAQKVTAMNNYERLATNSAFNQVVQQYGRDKYLASLAPDKQSQFKVQELTDQLTQQAQKTPYAGPDGKPMNQDMWGQYDAAIKAGVSNPQKRTLPAYKSAEKFKKYATANQIKTTMASPDFTDYATAKWLTGLSPEQKAAFTQGSLNIVGSPGQFSTDQQLQLLGLKKLYDALPAGDPQKNAMKVRIQWIDKNSQLASLKIASPSVVAGSTATS